MKQLIFNQAKAIAELDGMTERQLVAKAFYIQGLIRMNAITPIEYGEVMAAVSKRLEWVAIPTSLDAYYEKHAKDVQP